MPIDHVGVRVADLSLSRDFYAHILRPLGLTHVGDVHGWAGFGAHGRASFWCGTGSEPPQPTHVAFRVASRQAVHEFFDNAVAHGARVKSPPGLFPEYHAAFYAAMVLDPDGHNIEAVCHEADGAFAPESAEVPLQPQATV
ncbi:MAG: VOC family protein [Pseudomonadota bacterium]